MEFFHIATWSPEASPLDACLNPIILPGACQSANAIRCEWHSFEQQGAACDRSVLYPQDSRQGVKNALNPLIDFGEIGLILQNKDPNALN